jgi:hypothetical protein
LFVFDITTKYNDIKHMLPSFLYDCEAWFFFEGKGKGVVVPVLPLTEHHAMKAYWGVEV